MDMDTSCVFEVKQEEVYYSATLSLTRLLNDFVFAPTYQDLIKIKDGTLECLKMKSNAAYQMQKIIEDVSSKISNFDSFKDDEVLDALFFLCVASKISAEPPQNRYTQHIYDLAIEMIQQRTEHLSH